MTFVSLFAGIGGIDLGLERAGHECVGQVEIDDYCQKVLAKHWPDTPRIADVRDFQGDEFGPFDMLTAGYPCQPFSVAGRREGDSDPRHLWPEALRIVRRVRPRLILLENVPGHLALGFGRVQGDLAESGYDAEWDCIPAAAVGAPHLRDRVFIVAHTREQRPQPRTPDQHGKSLPYKDRLDQEPTQGRQGFEPRASSCSEVADTKSQPCYGRQDHIFREPGPLSEPGDGRVATRSERPWRISEPSIRRGAHGVPHRVDRLRALGNAVVPAVAQFIGARLAEVDHA